MMKVLESHLVGGVADEEILQTFLRGTLFLLVLSPSGPWPQALGSDALISRCSVTA